MSPDDLPDDLQEAERRDFEQQVVCKLLRAGNLVGDIKSYVDEHQRVWNTPQLSLMWFHARYPEFPVRLVAVLFAEQPPDWPEMFHRFTATSLFRAYRRACEKAAVNDRQDALGVVFNMDGVTFVLHNYEPASELPGRRFIRRLGNPPVAFAFEEFETLLGCIGDDWARPAAPETEVRP